MKEKTRKISKISICLALFLILSLGVIYAANVISSKGELNDDGIIDYSDVNLLEKHLIHLQALPEEKHTNADMNGDGEITVTDLSFLIKKIENKRDYTVELINMDTPNYYPKKGETIEITFGAVINYQDVSIEKIVINNQEQNVENESGAYKIKVNVGNQAGKQEYHINKVILNTGAEVKVDNTISVCVLKAEPYIEENSYKLEETFEGKAYINFNLVDQEQSITSAQFSVYEIANIEPQAEQMQNTLEPQVKETEVIVAQTNITAGENRHEVHVEDGKTYRVIINVAYNAAKDPIEGKEYTGESFVYSKEFTMALDYQFSISNIHTLKDGQESNKFAKKEPITIQFDSTNIAYENTGSSNFEPSTITVNNKQYEVTKQEDRYVATIDGLEQIGENTITIEKVKLKNGKEIVLETGNTVTITIDAQKPVVSNLKTEENVQEKNMKVTFHIEDEAKSIQSAKVVLYDSGENIIASQDITTEEIENGNIEKIFNTQTTDSYIIKVIANYQETEDHIITDSVLFEKEITANRFATIKNAKVEPTTLEKKETVKITYEIETNSESEVAKIRVNNLDCIATKVANGTYEIITEVGEEAKVLALTASKIIFADQTEAIVENTVEVTVLKDLPKIEEIKQEDNLANNQVTVTFTLVDPDNSFITGKVQLVKPAVDGNPEQVIQEPTIERDGEHGRVLFENVEIDKEYTARFIANYNRYPEGDENIEENQVIREAKIMLVGDYNLQVSDLKTANKEKDTKYFEKNEEITLSFNCTNATSFLPEKAIIDGKEYVLTHTEGTNIYTTKLAGLEESGVKEYKLETIILNNKRFLDVEPEQKIKIEVLKEKPTITSFGYKEDDTDKNKVVASFNLNDIETTISNGTIVILDDHKNEIKTQNLVVGNNQITFDKIDSEYYNIKVKANYDLDTNALGAGENEYQEQILLQEEIDFTERKIQLKDIQDVRLYHIYYGFPMEVKNIDSNEIIENPENYVAKVKMKNMPDMHANIKSCRIEQRKVILELDVENTIIYKGDERQAKVEVPFGVMGNTGSYVKNESFEDLLYQMRQYPTGTFNLTKDYDASEYEVDTLTYFGDAMFQGTINGNGHTIYNLQKPIFSEIERATIKNLVIENAYITSKVGSWQKGFIANEIYSKTVVSNVHIKNSTISTYSQFYTFGPIAGRLSGSRVEKCSVTNLSIVAQRGAGSRRVGGIVGEIGYGSTIEDCYATGEIQGSWEVGGIVGGVQDSMYQQNTIKHCIAKVNINGTSGPGNVGGIAGNANGAGRIKLVQNISLAEGSKSYKTHGSAITLDPDTFNYEMTESNLTANAENSNGRIKEFAKSEFSGEFCKEQAGFSDQIWNLDDKNYENIPTLKGYDPNNKQEGATTGNYIPDVERLKKMQDYDPKKEVAYSNLYKLMPFFDAKYLVVDGARISEDDVLNQKQIKTILPYNDKNEFVLTLTEENHQSIDHINVVFTDDTTKQYQVKFKNMNNHVVSYKLEELGIEYNFDKYVIKQDAEIVKKLVDYILTLDYDRDLKPLVAPINLGDRIYKDFFNETIKTEESAKQFVLNFLGNVNGYSLTIDNSILNNYIYDYLTKSTNKLKQFMFAYNYYSRFYGFEVSNMKVSDIVFFKGELYNTGVNTNNLVNLCLASNSLGTHVSYLFYEESLGPCVGFTTVSDFVEHNIKMFANNQDPNDWFAENFNGMLVETSAKGYEDSIDYRAWTQLKKQKKFILPMLTLPEDSGYMISAPTTFLVGSQRLYIREPGNQAQIQNLQNLMKNFANQIGVFYTTAAGFIEPSIFNKVCDVSIDTTVLPVLGEQKKGKSTDPFCKNFNELLNEWFTIRAVAAYSGSQRIYYVVDNTLTSYGRTWSHETGHNQCNFLFFKRNGFRPVGGCNNNDGSGTEDYTDGNTTQGFGDGAVNFNLSYNYDSSQVITTNLTTERINSTEKIESYYKRMFEAIDFLDYAEAKAFLQLTPEEQAKVAVQIYYPNAPGNYANVGWKPITKEEFEEMDLKTVEDIYDNQITIKPGVTKPVTQTGEQGLYGSEHMYIRRWYQPYNEKGRTHSYGFTYTSWQMLGIGGYDGGYITYFSGKSNNDLDAIKKVTKDPDMTWKKFKTMRYELMEDSWNTIPYLNSDELVEKYVDALKLDASNNDRNVSSSTNVRRVNYHYLKRVTDDFRAEVLDGNIQKVHIKTAEEFKQKLTENPRAYYVLDNDIDFSSITEGNAIVDGYFMGKLDGGGHKLTGNTIPIFNNIKFAYISNLQVENSNITSSLTNVGAFAKTLEYSQMENVQGKNITISATNKQVGGLVGSMAYSFVKNVHVTGSNIVGTTRVGGIAGYAGQSQVEESTVNGKARSTGNAAGGLIGEIYSKAIIRNCYTIGEVQGNQDIGGLVGYVNTSYIINSFSHTKATGNAGIASFVGQTTSNSIIKNNITLVNQTVGYKFDGRTATDKFTNFSGNYENKSNVGKSTTTRAGIDFTGKITEIDGTEVKKESFYTNTLTWDNNIWDFSRVASGGLPKLKNDDPNDVGITGERYSITNAEEFESLLKEHREATFVIEQDIDLSTLESTTTIIDGVFMGRIEGNNHTLRGNKVPIFHTARHTYIENLKIEGSNINKNETDVGALTKIADNIELKNVIGKDITVTNRRDDTGGLIGIMTYGDLENVHIIGGNVTGINRVGTLAGYVGYSNIKKSSSNGTATGTGNNVGGFMGEITNGTIVENCYARGTAKGNQNVGGFVGLLSKASTVSNSLSTTKVDGTDSVAGFVGQSITNSIVKNNIALGNQVRQHYKFDGKTVQEQLENYEGNYEYEGNKGIATGAREDIDFTGKISVANRQNITSKDFYTNTLGWNDNIWDFSTIASYKTPTLKNNDPNESVEIGIPVHTIRTEEEFQTLITQYPDENFTLENDIDLSNLESTTTIISGEFIGEIDGKNHSLKGNTVPIFHTIRYAKLTNLKLEGSNINKNETDVGAFAKIADKVEIRNLVAKYITVTNKNNNTGGLIGTMTASDLENVHIIGGNITGAGRVGILVGYVGTSHIKASSSNGIIAATGSACGGLVGEAINNTIIENSYSLGDAKGNQDIGGLVGVLRQSSVINCFSTLKALGNAGVSGFIGKAEMNSIVKNNIALGNQMKQYKFDGRTANDQFEGFEGNYEYEENTGISTLTREGIDFTGKISVATKQNITDRAFYSNTLGFDTEVWDLSYVSQECIPKLKNWDPNEKTLINKIDTYQIHSVDEFISLINAHPDGVFDIQNDIDFSGKTYTIGSSVVSVFYGEIRGNNHTITNLTNATLFGQFNGKVDGLNMENYNFGAKWKNGFIDWSTSNPLRSRVAAFALKASNATLTNMKFTNMVVLGNTTVAVIVAEDENCTYENIDLKQVYLNGRTRGNQTAAMVAIKAGGTIKNCYVQGELYGSGLQNGGVVSLTKGEVTIENVIANMYVSCGSATNATTWGGFVAKVGDGNLTVKNSAMIHKLEQNGNPINKFIATVAEGAVATFQNCYENVQANGIASDTIEGIKTVTDEELLTKDFYTNTVCLDENIWNLDNITEEEITSVDNQLTKFITFGLKVNEMIHEE